MSKKSERPITISYVVGEDMECDICGCEAEASYMAEGKTYCTYHWIKPKDEE